MLSIETTGQMLACVIAVNRLSTPSRPGELARQLSTILAAQAVAVERARARGTFVRLAEVGEPPQASTPVDATSRHVVAPVVDRNDSAAGDGAREMTSVWCSGRRPIVLRVWRRGAFSDADAAVLFLLHTHVGPMLSTTLPVVPPGVTADVLQLMLDGLPERKIAERLVRSHHTVHAHVKRIYQLFGVNSRPQLILRCME